jgi:hypothetical protein
MQPLAGPATRTVAAVALPRPSGADQKERPALRLARHWLPAHSRMSCGRAVSASWKRKVTACSLSPLNVCVYSAPAPTFQHTPVTSSLVPILCIGIGTAVGAVSVAAAMQTSASSPSIIISAPGQKQNK